MKLAALPLNANPDVRRRTALAALADRGASLADVARAYYGGDMTAAYTDIYGRPPGAVATLQPSPPRVTRTFGRVFAGRRPCAVCGQPVKRNYRAYCSRACYLADRHAQMKEDHQ